MEFLALLKKAGFDKAELVGKTGFNSSPKTEGVLLRGVKPESSIIEKSIPLTAIPSGSGEESKSGGT